MSNKYIIKACPNLTTSHYGTGETIHNQCGLTDDDLCANCTYCKLKQIVELCKAASEFCRECSKEAIYQVDCIECTKGGRAELGTEILQLLNIEECE